MKKSLFAATVVLIVSLDATAQQPPSLRVFIEPSLAVSDGAEWRWRAGTKVSNWIKDRGVEVLDVPVGELVIVQGREIKNSQCTPPASKEIKVTAGLNSHVMRYEGGNCK